MRNRILEIVVFLIDYMQGSRGHLTSSDELSSLLEAEGYSEDEISSAYSWLLHRFENAPEQFYANFPRSTSSVRILSHSERVQVTPEAYGFLIKLLSLSLIDYEQFEAILERSAMIGARNVTLDQMKLIVSSMVTTDFEDLESFGLDDEVEPDSSRLN